MVQITPEPTPNPNALKFTLDRPSTDRRTETFRAGVGHGRLAARVEEILSELDGVTNVFLTSNFVSVTKEDQVAWDELGPEVMDVIQDHFGEGADG